MLLQVQRRVVLRVCSAYRAVSTEAVLVIAGLIPMYLLVEERTAAHRSAGANRQGLRIETLEEWQRRWDNLRGKAA